MFAKVAVLLFVSCTVALARPQDGNALLQAQNQLSNQLSQGLNQNQPQYYNPNQLHNWNPLQGLNQNQLQELNQNQLQGLNQNQPQGLNQNQFQGLNPNQPQGLNLNQLQGLNPNQNQGWNPNLLQGLNLNQLQGMNPNLFQGFNPNQLQNLFPGLNNGQGNGHSIFQSPVMEVPHHAIDWSKNVLDRSINTVGVALNQAYDNTERVLHNVADTINEVGKRGFQDGTNLFKTGLGVISTIPRIGFGLLSRNNNNIINNGYGYQ